MTSVSVDCLFEQQIELFGFISRAVENLRKVGVENIIAQRVQSRLKALRTKWEKFQANHDRICMGKASLSAEMQVKVAKSPYFTESLFALCEETFLDAEETMTVMLDKLSEETTLASAPTGDLDAHQGPRLPRIDLPKFNGDHAEWVPFRDLFISLVCTNSKISNVEKLQYLKSSLTNSAAQRLKNVPVTESNFQLAWDDLVAYYDNKRLLVDAAMHTLFSLKAVSLESATDIERLHSDIRQAIGALAALGRPIENWDDFLVHLTVRKLDATSIKDWERELGASTEPPTWKRLETFLIARVRSLQAYERTAGKPRVAIQAPQHPRQGSARSHHAAPSTPPSQGCSLCGAGHYLSSCPAYLSKTAEQRRDLLVQKKLCFNCLGPHLLRACRTRKRCRTCGEQHHTSIHRNASAPERPAAATQAPQQASVNGPSSDASTWHCGQSTVSGPVSSNVAQLGTNDRPPVLLATAVVKLISRYGESLEARALLDQGSEISLITESLAQRLRLPRSRSSIPIVGIGAVSSCPSRGSIKLDLYSRVRPTFSCEVLVSVLPKLTGYIPSTKIANVSWPHLKDLDLADPNFSQPGRIDLVLGADVYGSFLEEGVRKGPAEAPVAQKTSLGWILSGCVPTSTALNETRLSLQCSPDHELLDLLKKFWVQEEVFAIDAEKCSPEDAQCEEHFATTHSRNAEGRYVVRLPFKKPAVDLGDSRTVALKMLTRMERRFEKDPALHAAYAKFLDEYESLGHMYRISDATLRLDRAYYLPHLCVIRPSSSTTKYRVVFNGSQRTDRGVSLNDYLHEGPKLLNDLADIITRWRSYEFVFSADIAKMFRQILLHSDDHDFQRILWRNRSGSLETFALSTVTYGLKAAPFLANRTLRQLDADEGHRFPLAKGVIEECTYVDDILSGANSLDEGREKIKQLIDLFKAGGFPLQKWTASHEEMLRDIASADRESSLSLAIADDPSYRALGLTWQKRADVFVFTFKDASESAPATKRAVLSHVAQLFDPLGWLTPVIVRAKLFLQELWVVELGWDDPLPQHLASKWREYAQQLKDISQISVSRWLGIKHNTLGIELHGFSDASHAALGAAVYVRVLYSPDDVRVTLVSAKSKIAPMKKSSKSCKRSRAIRITTPRLELSAAVLLVRHLSKLRRALKLEEAAVYLWTDSSTTLFWIQGHPSRWKDFVRNRVSLIQETLPDARWRHVPGEDNPADLASRGLTPNQLAKERIWWRGPAWLGQQPKHWPTVVPPPDQIDLEERQQKSAHVTVEGSSAVWDLVERYSLLTRLLRVTAWCFRAASRFRQRGQPLSLSLTPEEIDSARLFWVKTTQRSYFASEMRELSRGETISRTSPLFRLIPFLDSNGMLRVSGRLSNALLDPDTKHPLILPRDSALTLLVLDHTHRLTLHGGTQVMLATLRRSYWIVGGRAPVRRFVLRCITCTRQRAITATQLMGQLPISRTQPTRPFLHSGVDYAGPFILKTWRGRAAKTYKGYLIVFVCFSSSAVHLELATDYSAEGFLAAFKRFTGRRGICASLVSDCGKNLVGADAELRRLFDSSSRELSHLANLLANDGTTWTFNPPAAPHFGGKWEAAVKSVKFHLKRVVGDALLTYEEFSTLLVQIEAVLNSRPICPLSEDPSDIEALTPGHFLVGNALNVIPEPTLAKLPASRLSRWQLLRQMLEKFWQRWSTEHLQRFQNFSKWRQRADSIKIGSLVLVADERYPPSKWPLARVIAVHPGKDNLVRVVTVRTQTSILKRPIVKLCPLPVEETVS